MPYKDPAKNNAKWREGRRRFREENPEHYRTYQREYMRRRRAAIAALKGTTCVDCGGTFPPDQLDFHHRDPATKLFSISDSSRSLAAMQAEIAKCDVLCKSCHGKRGD